MDSTGAVDLGLPHLRTSERKSFKRCQQRWVWEWRQGLVPKIEKPGALWFGIGMHLVMQERYKYPGKRRGGNLLKVWREYVGDTQAVIYGDNYGDDKADFYKASDLGEAMIGGYLDKYGKDDRWSVISAEQTFDIPLPYPARFQRPGEAMLVYNGTFDLVARDEAADDSLWVWDHKNLKSVKNLAYLALDDQMGSYWALAGDVLAHQGLITPGEKLDGILYNILRKAMPDERPMNAEGLHTNNPQKAHYQAALDEFNVAWSPKDTMAVLHEKAEAANLTPVLGDVSKQQPDPRYVRHTIWRTSKERRTQIERMQEEGVQMLAIRNREMKPTKNPTMDCPWDCRFFEMCQLHEAGDDWREFRDAAFTKRDPYAAHREVVGEVE